MTEKRGQTSTSFTDSPLFAATQNRAVLIFWGHIFRNFYHVVQKYKEIVNM